MLNLVSFGRWIHRQNREYDKGEYAHQLRSLSVSIKQRKGAHQSVRYWGKNFPSFGKLVEKVDEECEKVSRLLCEFPEQAEEYGSRLQDCILVALQVGMRKIRAQSVLLIHNRYSSRL